MLRVAPTAETTQGMPSSRLTMIAWLSAAPTSTTTAAAGTNNGVHDGSVIGATRTSPGCSAEGSLESRITRAVPSATPGQPGIPAIVSPARQPIDRHRVAPRPGVGPLGVTDEHERRLQLLQMPVLGSPTANLLGQRVRIVEQRRHLRLTNEPEVLDLVERAELDHPAAEFAHRHAHLVDDPDVVGLGAFATGQPRRRSRRWLRRADHGWRGRRRPSTAARSRRRRVARHGSQTAGQGPRCRAPRACARSPPAPVPASSPTTATGSPIRWGRGCRTRRRTRRIVRRTQRNPCRAATTPTSRGSALPSRHRRCRTGSA